MLRPATFLDLVRNFIVFERDGKTGRTVRKLCRYQQYAAVNKAIARARTAKETDRGSRAASSGTLQGSGKSLTMLWLALKLRRDPTHENPTLVIVTDRKDLDEQIAKTFVACGFPNPDRADSVRHLRRRLLSGGGRKRPSGKTILTTVQKFQEIEAAGDPSRRRAREEFPACCRPPATSSCSPTRLTGPSTVALLRTFAKRYRTPASLVFRERRSTRRIGRPARRSGRTSTPTPSSRPCADGATVPIFYEGRLPEVRIIGNTLDAVFDRVFADRSEEEREAIKKKYGRESAVAGAPKRIETICLDLIDHYAKFIQPNGFKAQVVAVNRETAVMYKETLDRLQGPQSAIIMSATNKDEERLVRHHISEERRKELIARFCKPGDPLSILVVCDMLLTGFDAPVEQVMYLDAPLKEHTLLQAIARVNRTADHKDYGLIVDYWGVSESLQEALAIFAPTDVKGAMTPKTDELPRLQARHAAVLRFFARVRDKDDLEACVMVLAPEDVRAEFDLAFRRFAESLDMLLPEARGLPYVSDMRWFGKIRGAAAARFRDDKIDVSDCGAKVRELIENAVIADGIQILVQRVSLFTPEFDKKLDALKTDEARASEMEHAIKSEIHVKLEEDPAFYSSLRERLEKLIADRKAKRIDAAQQLRLFEQLRGEMRGRADVAESLGMSETGFAIYGLIADPRPSRIAEGGGAYGAMDDSKRELATILEEQLESQVTIVDWVTKDDVQKEMRRVIKRQLRAAGFAADKIDPMAESVVDLMKRRRGR